ncbi:type III pantothenate kinase [Neolewinella lacunae]|uniref:Type III pantothenate kinase n=1 Tax=Neolewinella lacunae TaxID=1517758 RepID=A0A923T6U9_9BACT|nr:type III pantothenate kinase [Neolewinella lacunae]MBC6993805.1 type III pantothenate kinase [Neolewinella lacunae]MDN3635304.1 type III pantothenate kinase [Neolewinella lacunae]
MATKTMFSHLAIDIGNSGAKAAVFRGEAMIGPVQRFTHTEWEVADRMVTNHGVKKIIYSTVANVPPSQWIDKWEKDDCLVLALSPALPLPFATEYATRSTLGQDRIAVVAGSLALSPSTAPAAAPKLIVDAGTCVTYDLVTAAGVHLGGNIGPGLRMRLRAMHEFTARLPLVESAPELPDAVGRSTVEALQHGGQMGLVYETEGMFHRLVEDFPGLELLLTGGDAEWLAGQLSIPCSLHPNLVLFGLHQILSYYVENEL